VPRTYHVSVGQGRELDILYVYVGSVGVDKAKLAESRLKF